MKGIDSGHTSLDSLEIQSLINTMSSKRRIVIFGHHGPVTILWEDGGVRREEWRERCLRFAYLELKHRAAWRDHHSRFARRCARYT